MAASAAAGGVDELGGQRASFTLALGRRPLAPVVCALSVDDASEGAVPADVTLDGGNWRGAQARWGAF